MKYFRQNCRFSVFFIMIALLMIGIRLSDVVSSVPFMMK